MAGWLLNLVESGRREIGLRAGVVVDRTVDGGRLGHRESERSVQRIRGSSFEPAAISRYSTHSNRGSTAGRLAAGRGWEWGRLAV